MILDKSFGLVNHVLAEGGELPPIQAAMLEYVYAGNGIFVRGRRAGVEAMIPYVACRLNYLEPVKPYVKVELPKVPGDLVSQMLSLSQRAAIDGYEKLFYLSMKGYAWQLVVPMQRQAAWSVEPVEQGADSHFSLALIELHSHKHASASFSDDDDRGEFNLRFYSVIGRVFDERAEIRVRIGLNGYTHEIPATTIFDLPANVRDCLEGKNYDGHYNT